MAADVGNDVPLSTDEAINDSNEMVELLVSLGSDSVSYTHLRANET